MREKIKELLESNLKEDRKIAKMLLLSQYPEVKANLKVVGNKRTISLEKIETILEIKVAYNYINNQKRIQEMEFWEVNWPELFENENKE